MPDFQITDKTQETNIDRAADSLLVYDSSASALRRATVNNLLNLTSQPVGTTATQTLTNKTLTAPTISDPVLSGTVTGTYTLGGTPTFPSSVATLTGSQTLTNKTLTSPTINTPTITNPTLTVDTISEFTSANGVTIDGLNIKDGKLNTNNSVVASNITAGIITRSMLSTTTGELGGDWTTVTPTLNNFTIGNGTATMYYTRDGRTIRGEVFIACGSTTAFGTNPSFDPPVTPATRYTSGRFKPQGLAMYHDSGTNVSMGVVYFDSSTASGKLLWTVGGAAGTYVTTTGITSTVPFTIANGDSLGFTFEYEGAS